MDAQKARQLYADLGAVPVINGKGNYTMLGGSFPTPSVRAAMDLAGRYYVDMDALFTSTGRIAAELLGCEAALITPGCAAALVLGTAACVSGDDPKRMEQLPNTMGMKSQVVIQHAQRYRPRRYTYERVVRLAGVELVPAGTLEGCNRADLEQAITDDTAAVLYPDIADPDGWLSLEEVVEIAHARGVPVIADTAFRVYPVERMRSYSSSGADLWGFGAKYFGAPNSSGILCGRADLVAAASAHSFAAFERRPTAGIGRPLKIDRQEVVGVITALREWLGGYCNSRDEEASRRGRSLRNHLQDLSGIELSPEGDRVTSLTLTVDLAKATMDAETLASELE
ncbi:MAG: hypothetical protein VX733_12275, partial [Candidatus Latescibacterota bacterium]|nr:hypothetical protein [Candidatus Latescibacterota bacterium]